MKKDDITIVVVVIIFSTIIALFLSKFIVSSSALDQSVRTVSVVNTSFSNPNSQYFNSNSIDPTQLITIGNNNNDQPFPTTTN